MGVLAGDFTGESLLSYSASFSLDSARLLFKLKRRCLASILRGRGSGTALILAFTTSASFSSRSCSEPNSDKFLLYGFSFKGLRLDVVLSPIPDWFWFIYPSIMSPSTPFPS